jgi:hypothetical protein
MLPSDYFRRDLTDSDDHNWVVYLFIYNLFRSAGSNSGYIGLSDWMTMKNKLEMMWKKAVMV